MAIVNPTLPTIGDPRGSEEGDVRSALVAILNEINGNIDAANVKDNSITVEKLLPALADALGVNETGIVRRGATDIATEESRSNTAYGTLTTPDQVANVVLPTKGLIVVAFQAMWKESVDGAASAAIFIGGNQLKQAGTNVAAPVVNAAIHACGTPDTYKSLGSFGGGLQSANAVANATAYTGDVTTGQIVGPGTTNVPTTYGPVLIFAAAGTYTISVQFKATSGSVTAKNRKLWVDARGY